MKILLALSTYNRPIITELCLKNLQQVRSDQVKLVVYDDASTAYSKDFLQGYSDEVVRFNRNGGIERSRAKAIRDFVYRYLDFDLIYFTDNDAIHDPAFVDVIRSVSVWQRDRPEILPLSIYNCRNHSYLNNIVFETDLFVILKTMPGLSQCYTREMAEIIVQALNESAEIESTYGWDYIYPELLGRHCLVSKVSMVEHFARDRHEAGMHTTNSGSGPDALIDFERSRAVNPTPYLSQIRDEIIGKILGWD
jgi:glycosyltransferase involved in cell wall biosynthesis